MKLLAILFLAATCAGQTKPQTGTLSSTITFSDCHPRASGLCQSQPLTKAEEHEDEIYRQCNALITELVERVLPAKDVIRLTWIAQSDFRRDEETLKTLREIKTRTEPKPSVSSAEKPVTTIIGQDTNASGKASAVTDDENWHSGPATTSFHCWQDSKEVPCASTNPYTPHSAPKPSWSLEKAVKKNVVIRPESEGRCATGQYLVMHHDNQVWCETEQYKCPKHSNSHVFLLLDEASGDKFCLVVPEVK